MITKFKLYEELGVGEFDLNLSSDFFIKLPPDEKKIMYDKIKEVAKKGKLYNQLTSGRKLTFGVLKAIHHDAIEFKEHREYLNGIYKFIHRAVPIALAPFYLPVWLVAQALGISRALWKVLVPVMHVKKIDYKSYMSGVIEKVMDATEGEVAHFFDDWFYRSFAVEKGLINMARKEHVIDFAYKLAEKMEKEPDHKIVPPYYVENEFRKYLNREFRLNPPLPQKIRSVKNKKSSKQ